MEGEEGSWICLCAFCYEMKGMMSRSVMRVWIWVHDVEFEMRIIGLLVEGSKSGT